MDTEGGRNILLVHTEYSDTSQNLKDDTDQCKQSCLGDSSVSIDPSMNMMESDIVGYSDIPCGVMIHSQSSYPLSNKSESVIGIINSNKISSVTSPDNSKVVNDQYSGLDQSKRKRNNHDYKKLSKSGYVEDTTKWYNNSSSKPSDVGVSVHRSVSHVSVGVSDKCVEQDNKTSTQGRYSNCINLGYAHVFVVIKIILISNMS